MHEVEDYDLVISLSHKERGFDELTFFDAVLLCFTMFLFLLLNSLGAFVVVVLVLCALLRLHAF